jgi:anti-sigma B factor antagonist
MNFTIEQDERATIFRPKESRLDSLVAPELKAEFLILAQPDVEKLIIDLTDVDYIDSAGLSAFLLARRQQAEHEGDVRLVNPSPDVVSLLQLTQLDRAFPMYDSVEEALAAPSLSMSSVAPDGLKSVAGTTPLASAAFAAAAYDFALGDDELDDDDDDDDDDLIEIDEEFEGDEEDLVEEEEAVADTAVVEDLDDDDDDDIELEDDDLEEDDDIVEDVEDFDDDYDDEEDEVEPIV